MNFINNQTLSKPKFIKLFKNEFYNNSYPNDISIFTVFLYTNIGFKMKTMRE